MVSAELYHVFNGEAQGFLRGELYNILYILALLTSMFEADLVIVRSTQLIKIGPRPNV